MQEPPYNATLGKVGNLAFLYYCRCDGLGYQYTTISKMLPMADKLKVSILIDWRNLSYLRNNRQSFSVKRLHKYFGIEHQNLIYDTVEIDRIITNYRESVIEIRMGKNI